MPVTPVQTPAGIEPAFDLAAYYPILIYAVVCVLFATSAIAATHLFPFKPRKPTRIKQMPYESGMDPVGDAHQRFDVKFYLIAILFLVFDVELLFLYPWATVAYTTDGLGLPIELRWPVFVVVLVFLATLAIGYVYAWRKGVFQWR
jgi:NADH-quinone oxidoreductase subunit A